MSLWKWNDVELEINMSDVDFTERYEKAFERNAPHASLALLLPWRTEVLAESAA